MHEILEDLEIAGYHRGCGQPVREQYASEWLDVRGEWCERRDYYLTCDCCGEVDSDELLAPDDACEVCHAAPCFAGHTTCREHTDPILVACEERGLQAEVAGYVAERRSLETWYEVGRYPDMVAARAAIAGAGKLGRVRAIWAMPEQKGAPQKGAQTSHHHDAPAAPGTSTCFACQRPVHWSGSRFCWNCGAHIRGKMSTRQAEILAFGGLLVTADTQLLNRLRKRREKAGQLPLKIEPVGAGWRVRL